MEWNFKLTKGVPKEEAEVGDWQPWLLEGPLSYTKVLLAKNEGHMVFHASKIKKEIEDHIVASVELLVSTSFLIRELTLCTRNGQP